MSFHRQLTEHSELNNPYLKYIADLDISPKEKLELICIVGAILSHFMDHAFGVQTDQITLGSNGESLSAVPFGHDTIEHHPTSETASAQNDGVEEDSHPLGTRKP